MADYPSALSDAPPFIAPTSTWSQGTYSTSPAADAVYPQRYTITQASPAPQQRPSASGANNVYPQTFTITQQPDPQQLQQQQPPAAAVASSILFGKISCILFGVILVICGAVCQAGACTSIRYYAYFSEIGTGIWCGAWLMVAGSVAVVTGYLAAKNPVIFELNAVTSGLAVVAAVIIIVLCGVGFVIDVAMYDCFKWCQLVALNVTDIPCPCLYEDWATSAMVANGVMFVAGTIALFAALWIFVVSCIAVFRKPIVTQRQSMPVQFIQQPNATDPQNSTQVVPMQVQYVPAGAAQPMTASMTQSQQIFQVPVQFPSNSTQPNIEIRSQQVLSIPGQFVNQQHLTLKQPLPKGIVPPTTSVHERNVEDLKDDECDL